MSNKAGKRAPGFMIYDETGLALLSLPDDELGEVLRAAIRHKLYAESEPNLSSGLQFAFCLLQETIDRDAEKYIAKCEQNAANRAHGNDG